MISRACSLLTKPLWLIQHASNNKPSHYRPFLVGKVLSHSSDQVQVPPRRTGKRPRPRRVWGDTWQGWDERLAAVFSSCQLPRPSSTPRSSGSQQSAGSSALLSCTCPPSTESAIFKLSISACNGISQQSASHQQQSVQQHCCNREYHSMKNCTAGQEVIISNSH